MSPSEMIRHRFSVEQYHQMIDAGIFAPDDRLELIHGELVKMSPINRRHAAGVDRLVYLLLNRLGQKARCRIQNPITLADSEPQPDVAIVRWRDDFYLAGHPTPPDIYWVIEVADTTITYDRGVKVPLYLSAGIPEVWLVNLDEDCLEVYRQKEPQILRRGQSLTPLQFPEFVFGVDEILG
ncbi:Uma2 family endonuclease [Synechococcus sp. C9]|uniref:Uma2 family endonuclease n=1 Tax=Synechococcus sp. C9 TaxID=102119 RepID=UPI001FF33D3E|nr:Uma2 family endonuclease [Synechococcus sp. C9]